jgi:hypothetical protein
VIYFNLPQLKAPVASMESPLVTQQFASLLQRTLTENPTFDKAILTSEQPGTGLYTFITVRDDAHLGLSSTLYLLLSTLTLTAIPFYADDVAHYVISYELYVNGIPVKTYQHHVQQKSLFGIGAFFVALFIENSWLSPPWVAPREQAFAATARLFWLEGHRDGFF